MFRNLLLTGLVFGLLSGAVIQAQDQGKLPREDVVEVPAIGDGLCLSNVFQSNMVLQRDKPLNLWGWAKPGEEVTVSFADQQAKTKAADDRSWRVTLKPIPANNKPQTLSVAGDGATLTLENILVGDVWVLGGQSNMEFPISKVDDGELEIVSANFPQIRLLTMPKGKGFDSVGSFERLHEWSSWSSRHFRKGDWQVCTPESVREFTAIGYVFGRRLQMATQVPIGLIDTSIGGTTVETWTPADVVAKIDGQETKDLLKEWADKIAAFDPQADLAARIERHENRIKNLKEKGQAIPAKDSKPPSDLRPGPAADRNRPGYCYAGVIHPLAGLSVKGAVFHQGFNNCFSGSAGARMYYQVFGQMVAAWRSAFNDEQMPFCIISLCTAGEPQTQENFAKPMYDVGPLIREAQYKTFRDLFDAGDKGVGFVSCFDLRKSWYHPQIKIPAGERAAKWALVSQYEILEGRDAANHWLPPTVKKVEVVDGTIRLTMSSDIKTKDDAHGKMIGFAIAGEDRRFHPAEVQWFSDSVDNRNRPRYQRNVLVLSSPFVSQPLHYRHAWARNPLTNIVGARGVPLATQRSDDWMLEETPSKIPPPENVDLKSHLRRVRGLLMKQLELVDVQRRVQEAKATIEEFSPVVEKARAAAE